MLIIANIETFRPTFKQKPINLIMDFRLSAVAIYVGCGIPQSPPTRTQIKFRVVLVRNGLTCVEVCVYVYVPEQEEGGPKGSTVDCCCGNVFRISKHTHMFVDNNSSLISNMATDSHTEATAIHHNWLKC